MQEALEACGVDKNNTKNCKGPKMPELRSE